MHWKEILNNIGNFLTNKKNVLTSSSASACALVSSCGIPSSYHSLLLASPSSLSLHNDAMTYATNSNIINRISINNQVIGDLTALSGGLASGDVLENGFSKRIGNVVFNNLYIDCSQQLSPFVYYNLCKHNAEPAKSNGAIMVMNGDASKVHYRIQFNGATCISIHLPLLDRSMHDDSIGITLQMMSIKSTMTTAPNMLPIIDDGYINSIIATSPSFDNEQFQWKRSNFELHLDGLDALCHSIQIIEPLIINHQLNKRGVVASRGCSNMICTLKLDDATEILAWYKSALESNNIASNLKAGTLHLFGGSIKLNLMNVSLYSIKQGNLLRDRSIPTLTISMCIGSVRFV
jgi:hypothetical protein